MARRDMTVLMAYAALLALLVWPARAAIYVDCDNASGLEDGTREHPFRVISSGMAAASYGDTVLVMPGTYAEQIYVDMHDANGMNRTAVVMKDGVALVAYAGPDSTVIHGVATQAEVFFDSCGPGTVLSGFSLAGSGYGWGGRVSVWCWQSSPLISQNVMTWPYSGVYSTSSSSPTVCGNTIEQHVVFVRGSGGWVVGNDIDGGIWLDSYPGPSLPLVIEGNLVFSTAARWEDYGVTVAWGTSGDVLIVDNTIRDKEVGVALCFGELRGNRFLNNDVNVKVRSYCEPRSDILAEMNWWGTTVAAEIEAKIIDCADDPELAGCVDYEPWCMDEDCTQSSVQTLTWSSIKRMYVPRE